MNTIDQITKFYNQQKSITAMMNHFVKQFTRCYEDVSPAEQTILDQCVTQMFRKYYYCGFDLEGRLTLANIVKVLCERNFGRELVVVPVLDVVKTRKTLKLPYHIKCFTKNDHSMVHDLEFYLKVAADGLQMIEPGLLSLNEYPKFEKDVTFYDRHYLNILGSVALKAGYIECVDSEQGLSGKTVFQSQEFFDLEAEHKLRKVVEMLLKICSDTIMELIPGFEKEFTVERLAGFLKKPDSYAMTFEQIIDSLGLDMQNLSLQTLNDETVEPHYKTIFVLLWILDIYFFTPLGYYLQVIQPFYSNVYDFLGEFEEILSDTADINKVRQKLFSPVSDFELTALGAWLFTEGKRTRNEVRIPKHIGDMELYLLVQEFLQNQESEEEAEFDEAFFNQLMEQLIQTAPNPNKKKMAKVIEFPTKQADESKISTEEQVFVFKVKCFYAKRVWRQIAIKGTQSLDDLHDAIFDAFDLEPGHIYSFYLSNRFWDGFSEYTHPQADGRSAAKKKIETLKLTLKQKIAYIYDFGEEHRFEVELVALQEVDPRAKYPREVKRNKPVKTVCDECKSAQNSIEWYCTDHEIFLCEKCAENHEECFLTQPRL